MQRQKGPAAMGAQSHATESASGGRPRPKIWTQCTVLCLPLLVTVLLGLAGAVAYGLYSLGAALGVARTACGVVVALVTPAVVAGDPRTVTRWCWPSPVLSVVFGPIVVPRVIATAIALQWRAWGNRSAAAMRTTHTDWEVLSLPGVELSKRIAAGELTAEGLARLCIARLEAVNPELNAVVGTRFPQALDEARAIDTRLASVDFDPTTASPLLGVPTVVKECHEVVGMPFTGGVVGRLDAVGEVTCPAVQKAMDAGMVVLGVTNTSEACMFHESNNPIYGLTKNPYSLNHSAGGSSGGSAAACAAGAVPVAVASDVGGSIRIPSHFCGLFGHKPTGGTGTGGVDRFCQLGPTTRHAVDLMPFLRLLSKPTAPQSALTDPDATLAGVTIYILDTSVGSPALRSRVDPDQSDAFEAAVGALTKAGVTVKPLPAVFANKLTSGNNAFDWWSSCMDLEKSTPFAEVITEGVGGWAGQWIPLVQFVAATLGVSNQHSLPAAGLAVVEMANGLMPESYIRGKAAELEEMKRSLTSLLGEDGVILLPTLPTTAFRHHEGLIRFFDVASTCLFNVLEFPATTIPCGLSATSRLPRGVQCVGPCGADHRTIAVALKLEHLGVARWEKPF